MDLCAVLLSPTGLDSFLPLFVKLEALLVAMMGATQSSLRSSAIVLLNVLSVFQQLNHRRYDCHDWQLESPLPVTISEVGKPMALEIRIEDDLDGLLLCMCSPSSETTTPCDVLAPRVFSTHSLRYSPQTFRLFLPAL